MAMHTNAEDFSEIVLLDPQDLEPSFAKTNIYKYRNIIRPSLCNGLTSTLLTEQIKHRRDFVDKRGWRVLLTNFFEITFLP